MIDEPVMMHVTGPLGLRVAICGACWKGLSHAEQLVPFSRFRPDPETRLASCEHVHISRKNGIIHASTGEPTARMGAGDHPMIDLDAIRRRNEERKGQFTPEEWGADSELRSASADIDALLAEVAARQKDVREILRALGLEPRAYDPDPAVQVSVTLDRAKELRAEVERLRHPCSTHECVLPRGHAANHQNAAGTKFRLVEFTP